MALVNVYVVSNCYWRDGAIVIGAAVDRPGAEAVADRKSDFDGDGVTGWAEWKTSSASPDGKVTAWVRDALDAKGVHPSLYQEIVCVALEGVLEVLSATTDPGGPRGRTPAAR